MKLLIVTGLSGAGKTQAVNCLEDLGYYCVDNMPPRLINNFLALADEGSPDLEKVAFVADMRGGQFFGELSRVLDELDAEGRDYKVMFLEASEPVLIKRYKETRRTHPLSKDGSAAEGIEKEIVQLAAIRKRASYIIDTSNLKTAELWTEVKRLILTGAEDSFLVTVESFGYKNGIPAEADWVLDARFVPNPYYVPSLRHLTGNNAKIRDYVMRQGLARHFVDTVTSLVLDLIPRYEHEGKSNLFIAVGCTGGRHRSVALVNTIAERLNTSGKHVVKIHRDL